MSKSHTADLFAYKVTEHLQNLRPKQSQLGQYLTSNSIAKYMAGLFPPLPEEIRLIDAGAGAGALTVAFVELWKKSNAGSGQLDAHAYEIDAVMLDQLNKVARQITQPRCGIDVRDGDFVKDAAAMVRLGKGPRYTHAILNPPYKKINNSSDHRAFLRAAGLETVNLYSGFVGLTVALMEPGGEVVAIIPRSFCNGPYYQPFRRFILTRAAIRHIHLFGARNKAFKDDGVLQENVIVRLTCGVAQGEVTVSTSTDDAFGDYCETVHPFTKIVTPDDTAQFIHIPTGDDEHLLDDPAFRFRLEELDLSVSTGPVVDFRMKDDLCADFAPGTVPLLYPGHFSQDRLTWPKPGFKKPNAIRHTETTAKWLFPAGFYAVVRRFSAKEERRRIVANVVEPANLPAGMIGFENHLNVVHHQKKPLDEDMARGIAGYLNATAVDQYFRRFNGHTQVNAADLRIMRYPSRRALIALGQWARSNPRPSQHDIDARVKALA